MMNFVKTEKCVLTKLTEEHIGSRNVKQQQQQQQQQQQHDIQLT
jgi:recombinational DNA repair protein (RecF pathway)